MDPKDPFIPNSRKSSQLIPIMRHSNSNQGNSRNSGTGLRRTSSISQRESFGRASSQPRSGVPSPKGSGIRFQSGEGLTTRKSGSEYQPEPQLRRSNSITEIPCWSKIKPEKGDELDKTEPDHKEVTRHSLFKEALYTTTHVLGKPSKRFPATKEEISIYVHQTFSISKTEQEAVIQHVLKDPYPLTIVCTIVKQGDGLLSISGIKPPNTYCIVEIVNEDTLRGKGEWQQFTTTISPINKSNRLRKGLISFLSPSDLKQGQYYERVPKATTTTVQPVNANPVWEQRFQSVVLRPSDDVLVIQAWDHIEDRTTLKSIQDYTKMASQDYNATGKPPINLGNMQPDSKPSDGKREREDEFLGQINVKVDEISCDGMEDWFPLDGKTKAKDKQPRGRVKLKIWLVHAYRHGKHYAELVEPKVMLECLWDWILGYEKSIHGSGWEGYLPTEATCLLYQYALQNGISEDTHVLIRWNAYAKYHLEATSVGTRLQELNGALKRKSQPVGEARKSTLHRSSSQTAIEDSILELMNIQILPVVHNHLYESEAKMHEVLKSFKQSREVLSQFDFSPTLKRINWLFENAIRLCILEWYQKTFANIVHNVDRNQRCDLVTHYVEVFKAVNALMQTGLTKWSPLFWLDVQTRYMPIIYDELQKMVNHDVEAICWFILRHYDNNTRLRRILISEDKEEECLAKALFSLYVHSQIFAEMQNDVFDDEEVKPEYDNLDQYHRWFRPILVLWLGFTVVRGSEMVTKCINIDNVSVENLHTLTSTSALDTATVFHQMVHFWETLRWPDIAENYVIIHFLLEVMCFFTVLYARRKREKLELEGYFDTEDRFDISERLCTSLNNIQYVKEQLDKIPEQLKLNELLETLELACGLSKETQAYRNRLDHIRMLTFINVERLTTDILKGVGSRVRPELSVYIRETLDIIQRSDTDFVESTLDPVLSYLEGNFATLNKSLLSLNFAKMLQLFWNNLGQELANIAPSYRMRSTVEQIKFFRRVLMLLPLLEKYFEGGDAGLSKEEMQTSEFKVSSLILTAYTLETAELMGMFYRERAIQQVDHLIMKGNQHDKPAKYGHLVVRVGYWGGKLTVEVLSAVKLTASDNYSFNLKDLLTRRHTTNSDPFVEVELLPHANFNNARISKTATIWKTLNPEFNEKFQWDVTLSECLKEDSVILFSVKDYDVLTSNDFLGEAWIPLSHVPGIAEKSIPQPMHLYLRALEPSYILEVLKSRSFDDTACKFYDSQAERTIILP